jgi:hypothetical protein
VAGAASKVMPVSCCRPECALPTAVLRSLRVAALWLPQCHNDINPPCALHPSALIAPTPHPCRTVLATFTRCCVAAAAAVEGSRPPGLAAGGSGLGRQTSWCCWPGAGHATLSPIEFYA